MGSDHPLVPKAVQAPKAGGLLPWLASPRWMLAFFIFAGAGAVVSMERPEWITAAWVIPLSIFSLSLLAAVATNRRFRRDPLLLGLHAGLLVFVVLVVLARLTYLDGAVTLTQGAVFDGQLQVDRRGSFHPGKIEELRFANEGFVEDFALRARWRATTSRVQWWDGAGRSHVSRIGDDQPLVLDGYRIYTTPNRGYSPMFRWQPRQGGEEYGAVQLRRGEFDQANDWQLPGGPDIWVQLQPDQDQQAAALKPGERRANLGAGSLPHHLVVRSGQRRDILRLGESVDFPEGRLTYVRLDSWMGYHLVYDVAMYWMAAAAAVVVLCMIAFYARILGRGGEGKKLREDQAWA